MTTKIIDYSKFKYNTSTFMSTLFERCAYENSKDLRASIKKLDNINITDKYGNTLLHKASSNANIELIKFLIENGININAQNNNGNTALFLLLQTLFNTDKNMINMIKCNILLLTASTNANIDLIKFLIENGIDINTQNGNTTLYLVLQTLFNTDKNIINMIKYFCEHGVNINLFNKDSKGILNIIMNDFERFDCYIMKFSIYGNRYAYKKEYNLNQILESMDAKLKYYQQKHCNYLSFIVKYYYDIIALLQQYNKN